MPMRYISTRGGGVAANASQAILRGLAEDGGLYVPEAIPRMDRPMDEWLSLSYPELTRTVLRLFLDFSEEELTACVEAAYAQHRFDDPLIAPVKMAAGVHFLELFHGPTLAFKDMALSILPHLMKTAAAREGIQDKIVILTATSGDTGKAALEAFCDVPGTQIAVFYPQDGVSAMQKRQMITQEGENTHVFGVRGNFDDAQTGVKKIFADTALTRDMAARGLVFSSANSINIGRLLPQIVYYFYAYAQLVRSGAILPGGCVNFVVPTGNFGNILAGYYAKEMGLPIYKLICASNDNKVLYDFFKTGVYDRNREFFCTISPSMDILVSSNLERLLFHATRAESVHRMMEELNTTGRYETTAHLPDFFGAYVTENAARQAIFESAQQGYVMDPHTAVAYDAAQQYVAATGDRTAQVVVSTASPFKFAEDVLIAVTKSAEKKDAMDAAQELAAANGLPIPEGIAKLTDKTVRHTLVCDVTDMQRVVEGIM